MPDQDNPDEPAPVLPPIESLAEDSAAAREAAAGRTLALGIQVTGDGYVFAGSEEHLELAGIPYVQPLYSPSDVRDAYERSEELMSGIAGVRAAVTAFEAEQAPQISVADVREDLLRLWEQVATTADPAAAVATLRLLRSTNDPLISAAASSGLHKRSLAARRVWPQADLDLSRAVLRRGLLSVDIRVRQLSLASLRLSPKKWEAAARTNPGVTNEVPPPTAGTSLIMHGTWSYRQRWWDVGGDFWNYARTSVRPNLHSTRSPDWSGGWSRRSRVRASGKVRERLDDWGVVNLDTVFAHSFGGAVALGLTAPNVVPRATRIETMVLLSAPAEHHGVDWRRIGRTVALQTPLDAVLMANRAMLSWRRVGWGGRVEVKHLRRWFFSHGDSHDPVIWQKQDWKARLRL